MKRAVAFSALSLATLLATAPMAVAQERGDVRVVRHHDGMTITVRPKSWLRLGNNVAPYSSVNPASAYGQTVSYLNSPPYINMRERFGEDRLPDPVTNGPFVGATNPIGPVDFGAPFYDD